MNVGDVIDVRDPCVVCGESRAIVRDGFQFCIECDTRFADSKPMLDFTQEYNPNQQYYSKVAKGKVAKTKLGEIWTTWHAHNMILAGLTEELGSCSSRERQLKNTALKVWGYFLKKNRIAFFENKLKLQPKLPFNFTPRDLEYLYDIKKVKRIKNKEKTDNDEVGRITKRKQIQNKTQFIKQQHKEFVASQGSTQQIASQTLADLETDTDAKPTTIEFTKRTRKLINKKLSDERIKQHQKEGFCGPGCRCLQFKNFRIANRKYKLSILNLYAILILALRINNDDIQVADVLRWCREGHISYVKYDHFFPDDMIFKKSDRKFRAAATKISHYVIRKSAGDIARYLNFKCIKAVNVQTLVQRYIIELELPSELYFVVSRIMATLQPLSDYDPQKSYAITNYEAIAMSYIIVTLKILFKLDGKIEYQNSESVQQINEILSLKKQKKKYLEDFGTDLKAEEDLKMNRLFNWKQWMEYIEYRKISLSEYHYPTQLQLYPNNYDNPKLFLHHKKVSKRDLEVYNQRNEISNILKPFLEKMEDSYDYDVKEESYPTFYCSLYPMTSSIETLLLWNFYPSEPKFDKSILEEDFSRYNISYLFNQKRLQKTLKKFDINLRVINDVGLCSKRKFPFCASNVEKERIMSCAHDIEVIDCLESNWLDLLRIDNINKVLEEIAVEDSTENTFSFNVDSENHMDVESCEVKDISLILSRRNYWIHHYKFELLKQKEFLKQLHNDLSSSFVWLLEECANMVEMHEYHLYIEVCRLEKRLMKNVKNLI